MSLITNKTDVNNSDDIWSSDILEHEPEHNTGYRYVLVVFDSFSIIVWTIPVKTKIAQTEKRVS